MEEKKVCVVHKAKQSWRGEEQPNRSSITHPEGRGKQLSHGNAAND